MNSSSPFGDIVGRVANRIRGAAFTLNGTHYNLVPNNGNNRIHGGPRGFSLVIWKAKRYEPESANPSIQFSYHGSDGEGGFLRDLLVSVMNKLIRNNQMIVTMKATVIDKPTLVNLAQHAFWNLGGHSSNIFTIMYRFSDPILHRWDTQFIPTGKIVSVNETSLISPHLTASEAGSRNCLTVMISTMCWMVLRVTKRNPEECWSWGQMLQACSSTPVTT